MNLASNESYTASKTVEQAQCKCGAQPKIFRKIMDPRTGTTVRMFECECGQRTWTELKT